jgi:hypothetical protein
VGLGNGVRLRGGWREGRSDGAWGHGGMREPSPCHRLTGATISWIERIGRQSLQRVVRTEETKCGSAGTTPTWLGAKLFI